MLQGMLVKMAATRLPITDKLTVRTIRSRTLVISQIAIMVLILEAQAALPFLLMELREARPSLKFNLQEISQFKL
ncbi:hypothetical protein D3C75_785560 [compost metagenome]